MNLRDLAEIKRRLNPDKRNPSVICGYYADYLGNPITSFRLAVGMLAEPENEKYMALFKKALSGQIGQSLMPIGFPEETPEQMEILEKLMAARDSGLQDEDAVCFLFEHVIAGLRAEHPDMQSVQDAQTANNWLILLLHDTLDVRRRGADGEIDAENSDRSFSYVLCAICPVKQAKPALRYDPEDSIFHDRTLEWLASAPTLGFLFPLFEDGAADVHSLLFFSKDRNEAHREFLQASFRMEAVMPAAEQTETFQSVLSQSLGTDCSLEVMQEMQETVSAMMEERQKDREAEPLMLTGQDVAQVLTESGVPEERVEAFQEGFDQVFGAGTVLPAVNIVPSKQFRVELPGVSIKADPDHRDLLETRVIDGRSYLLIPIEGEIEVNGQPVFAPKVAKADGQ